MLLIWVMWLFSCVVGAWLRLVFCRRRLVRRLGLCLLTCRVWCWCLCVTAWSRLVVLRLLKLIRMCRGFVCRHLLVRLVSRSVLLVGRVLLRLIRVMRRVLRLVWLWLVGWVRLLWLMMVWTWLLGVVGRLILIRGRWRIVRGFLGWRLLWLMGIGRLVVC